MAWQRRNWAQEFDEREDKRQERIRNMSKVNKDGDETSPNSNLNPTLSPKQSNENGIKQNVENEQGTFVQKTPSTNLSRVEIPVKTEISREEVDSIEHQVKINLAEPEIKLVEPPLRMYVCENGQLAFFYVPKKQPKTQVRRSIKDVYYDLYEKDC